MGCNSFNSLLHHVGHRLVCVTYGEKGAPDNVAIECETCHEVILDFDSPEWGEEVAELV